MLKSCLHDLSVMAFMKNRTHSRCYFLEMCAVYLYTLWINTIERRCYIRFACRISEHR